MIKTPKEILDNFIKETKFNYNRLSPKGKEEFKLIFFSGYLAAIETLSQEVTNSKRSGDIVSLMYSVVEFVGQDNHEFH